MIDILKKIHFRPSNINIYIVILVALQLIAFDLLSSFLVFPITEGWWEVYAWLNSDSQKLYTEYNVQFPPLYIEFIGFFYRLFDGHLIDLRLLMVCVHFISVSIFIIWLRSFVGLNIAFFAVAMATSLVMQNPVYLPKDYHTLAGLILIGSLLHLTYCNSKFYSIMFSGCLLGTLFLVKQNLGVFYGGSVLLYLIASSNYTRWHREDKKIQILVFFGLGFILPPIIYTVFNGFSWLSVFVGNDSKGGLTTVLFRFLLETDLIKIEVLAITLSLLLICISNNFCNNNVIRKICDFLNLNDARVVATNLVLGLSIVGALKYHNIIFSIALSWAISRVYVYKSYGKDAKFKNIYIPLLGLAYCGTQTAGFNLVSMEYLIGLFFGEYMFLLGGSYGIRAKEILLFGAAVLTTFLIQNGIFREYSYNWWGLKSDSIYRSNYETSEFEDLKYIKLDSFTKELFDYLLNIKLSLSNGDTVIATPNIPYVYKVLDIKPKIPPVLWFDVTSTSSLSSIIDVVEKQSPRYIVYLAVPNYVYDGHFKLRKKDPVQYSLETEIISSVTRGDYVVDFVTFQNNAYKKYKSINQPVNFTPYIHKDKIENYCIVNRNQCRISFDGDVIFKNPHFANEIIKKLSLFGYAQDYIVYGLKRSK